MCSSLGISEAEQKAARPPFKAISENQLRWKQKPNQPNKQTEALSQEQVNFQMKQNSAFPKYSTRPSLLEHPPSVKHPSLHKHWGPWAADRCHPLTPRKAEFLPGGWASGKVRLPHPFSVWGSPVSKVWRPAGRSLHHGWKGFAVVALTTAGCAAACQENHLPPTAASLPRLAQAPPKAPETSALQIALWRNLSLFSQSGSSAGCGQVNLPPERWTEQWVSQFISRLPAPLPRLCCWLMAHLPHPTTSRSLMEELSHPAGLSLPVPVPWGCTHRQFLAAEHPPLLLSWWVRAPCVCWAFRTESTKVYGMWSPWSRLLIMF